MVLEVIKSASTFGKKMTIIIGAAVVITAFSACIAPWFDRQDERNDNTRESDQTLDKSDVITSSEQSESLKDIVLNGLRKFTSVCIPTVDMTGSLQYFMNKQLVDIDINIVSQSTQTDSESSYFTAAESTRTADDDLDILEESERIFKSVSQCDLSDSRVDHQDERILVPRVPKPPRAHPPRKSKDFIEIPKNFNSNEAECKMMIERTAHCQSSNYHRSNKIPSVIDDNYMNNPLSRTSFGAEPPEKLNVAVIVHCDPSSLSIDSVQNHQKVHENSRGNPSTLFSQDLNNNCISSNDSCANGSSRYLSSTDNPEKSLIKIREWREKSSTQYHPRHSHSSPSFVTRIKIVLSRYFGSRSKHDKNTSQEASRTVSSGTDNTNPHYPRTMSTCITQDLNAENEKSKLPFSFGEVSSSTKMTDEGGVQEEPLDLSVHNKSRMNFKELESNVIRISDNRNDSTLVGRNENETFMIQKNYQSNHSNKIQWRKSQQLLSQENIVNSKNTISDAETEYPTFVQTKKGIFDKLKKWFHRNGNRKNWSILSESRYHRTSDFNFKANFIRPTVPCTQL